MLRAGLAYDRTSNGREPSPLSALSHADAERRRVNARLDSARRVQFGQFMTPASIADLMASASLPQRSTLRILDPGAGVGSLTAALADRIASSTCRPDRVKLTAFEIEPLMIESLASTLAACQKVLIDVGVDCETEIRQEDFLEYATLGPDEFDVAILNPPYKKLGARSGIYHRLRSTGLATPNFYSSFVAAALSLLSSGGSAVAITPRSFCNGSYFANFREYLHRNAAIRWLHVYETRSHAFADDDVLQENVIMHLVKDAEADEIILSSSDGRLTEVRRRVVPAARIVHPDDPEKFIRVPSSEHADRVLQDIRHFKTSLDELNLVVSTGRVVDFRAIEHLRKDPEKGAVPLIYPSHFSAGCIAWPIPGFRKYNAISLNDQTVKLLNPAGTYALVRRFSAKEERRRVVATIYDGSLDAEYVAFENHLNYYHANGRPLDSAIAAGLFIYLNSTLVDDYVRQFNGHTQVNAGDLRSLRYPSSDELLSLGAAWKPGIQQREIDQALIDLLS